MNSSLEPKQTNTQQRHLKSLHHTLLIWFLVLALLPMIITAVLGYQQAQDSLKTAASQQLTLSSVKGSQFINSWFDFRFKEALSHAETPSTKELFLSLQELWRTSGEPLKPFTKSFKWALTASSLDAPITSLLRHYDYISNAYLIDLNGNIIYSKKRHTDLGTNLFKGGLKNSLFSKTTKASQQTGKILFSDIEHYAPYENNIVGFITTPLLSDTGNKIGIFALQIRFDAIFDHMKTNNHSLKHYLVGEDGLLRSSINNNNNNNNADVLKTKINTEQFKRWQLKQIQSKAPLIHKNEQTPEYIGPNGSLVIGVHHTLHLGGVNWALISEIDQDEALAAATYLKQLTLFLALLTSIVVALIASYQSRRITKPLTQLIDTLVAVKSGNTYQRADVQSNNEIAILADEFNSLLDAQQQHLLEVKQSNEDTQLALTSLEEQKFVLDQHAIVSITDIKGNITLVNDKFCEISGYTREELIGENHRVVNSGHHDSDFFKSMYTRIAKGDVWQAEICNKAKNDQLYWVRSTIMASMGANGKPQSYIAIRTDITAVKTAEENAKQMTRQISRSKEQLDLVMENTGVGIWDWQILTGEIEFNERWAEITGYTLDELEPLNMTRWSNQFHPDDLSRSSQLMEKHFDGETDAYETEARLKHKDGHWVWVLDSGSLVERDENGFPKRMIGTLLDISKRKQAELEALKALAITDATLESTDNAIVVNDTQTNILFFNKNFMSLWELTPEIMKNHDGGEVTPYLIKQAVDPEKLYNQIIGSINNPKSIISGSISLKDGREIEFDTKPLIMEGQMTGRVWCFTDVSERYATERAIIEAKEIAEAANKTKGDFLANMSHEIRTPMNGVLGMTELLLDNPLDDAQQSRALTIKRSAESLLTIINDILDFSKIEAGKLDLEMIDFNLADLIEDIADSFRSQLVDKPIEFICSANLNLPQRYYGDPGRIRQILNNLISNAIKFTDEGEVAIHYLLKDGSDGQTQLYFSVQDSGIGLSTKQQQNLFNKFSQADNSITRKFGGTGLGLAICKQLVELMHGEIGIHSEIGKGSNFWFQIQVEESVAKATDFSTNNDINLHNHRVLVVDDNATNRQVYDDFLTAWKIPHEISNNAADALEILRHAAAEKSPFSIALIDMQMPEMDGIELGRIIHNDKQICDTRLALFTSLGQRGDAKKTQQTGFSAYLTKPLQRSQLYNALLQMIAKSSNEVSDTLVTQYTAREQQLHFDAKVLIVDDNEINQAVARGMLGKYGIDADIANNGQEALDMLSETAYDLVFMDCQMPIMDGYTATQKIRDPESRVKNHRIPVVAMTANAMIGDREKCLDAGMDGFLAKPVDSAQLQKQLHKWLKNKLIDADTYQHNRQKNKQTQPDMAEEIPENSAIVFDYEAISERLMGDTDLIKIITDAFLTDMPVQIELLKNHITNADFSQCAAQAHKIKGSSASVGAIALSEIAHKIEKAANTDNLSILESALTDINHALEILKSTITEKLS